MTRFQMFYLLLMLSFSSLSEGKLIQIIHTNDLHSYFSGFNNGNGGYAKVLTKIKELKEEARSKGIEVLQLDAGDWGDGTSFYLSDNGDDSIRALELLGTEVAAIGNHDFQLGPKNLAGQIKRTNVKTKFVAANIQSADLNGIVAPYVDVKKAGIPIRIIGLTTSESFFQYSVKPGRVLSPISIGEREAKKAKESGAGLVIALTHIGLFQDKYLARNSSNIDVIVGGHSHNNLFKLVRIRNREDKKIPIAQAWAHGLSIGSLILDVDENGGGAKVIDYKLHPVTPAIVEDQEMKEFVTKASVRRNDNLDRDADEVIGETKTPMTGYVAGLPVRRSSCWGYHMARASRLSVKASLGIHVPAFEGVWKAPGTITYGDLADNFPHIRKFGDQGWEISTIKLSGLRMRTLLFFLRRVYVGMTVSGLGKRNILDSLEGSLDDKANYTLAFPAEVALAIMTTMPRYQSHMRELRYTGKYYWPVLVDYIRENSPVSCEDK
jgi:2',3'-cyclic-nucleotide 2'-phosphodiesterase (5'-nucleotidase family)